MGVWSHGHPPLVYLTLIANNKLTYDSTPLTNNQEIMTLPWCGNEQEKTTITRKMSSVTLKVRTLEMELQRRLKYQLVISSPQFICVKNHLKTKKDDFQLNF